MNKKLMVWLLLLLTLALPAHAQSQEETLEQFMGLLRQDLKERRNAALRGILQLDAQQAREFAPLQNAFDEELAEVDTARKELLEDFASQHGSLTASSAQALADRFFRIEKQHLAMDEKYFRRISDKVSTIIAVQFLQLQRQYETLGAVQLSSRTPIAGGDGASHSEILDGYLKTMKKNINASRDKALAEILRLDEADAPTFQGLKKEYDKEFNRQSKARRKLLTEYGRVYKELTPDLADSLAARVLAQHNDRIELHRKYLEILSGEISAVVAVQFLQVQYRFETMADLKAASYVPIVGM